MLSISVDHPDVTEFVDIKANTDQITNANISVKVTDGFMKAVEEDRDYFLGWPCGKTDYNINTECEYNTLYSTVSINGEARYYKKIKARDLFHKLAKNNWDYGEPGILYWNKITSYHLMSEDGTFEYAGVNPCA